MSRRHAISKPQTANGYQMIRSIRIRNFRCFRDLEVPKCKLVNVIVGDSGVGKTALLEAMFLALGANPEIALRLRQNRGLAGTFSGSIKRIQDDLWGEFFYLGNMKNPISISLSGNGPEARSLEIFKGTDQLIIPLGEDDSQSDNIFIPITLRWTDENGNTHDSRPVIHKTEIKFDPTGEDLPDFYFFGSAYTVSAAENADRFSRLSRRRKARPFVDSLIGAYDWIEDLSIEVSSGQPIIHASIKGVDEKIPLNNVSGGINRTIGIMLAISSTPRSVVLVDEIENGLYYKRYVEFWNNILSFAREFETQLFLSTHNAEILAALSEAMGPNSDDVSLWRLSREESGPVLDQFDGETFKAGIQYSEEIR